MQPSVTRSTVEADQPAEQAERAVVRVGQGLGPGADRLPGRRAHLDVGATGREVSTAAVEEAVEVMWGSLMIL